MSTIDIGKIQATTRNTALGMLGLLLALTACTPSTPQTGGTSPAAATSPPARCHVDRHRVGPCHVHCLSFRVRHRPGRH